MTSSPPPIEPIRENRPTLPTSVARCAAPRVDIRFFCRLISFFDETAGVAFCFIPPFSTRRTVRRIVPATSRRPSDVKAYLHFNTSHRKRRVTRRTWLTFELRYAHMSQERPNEAGPRGANETNQCRSCDILPVDFVAIVADMTRKKNIHHPRRSGGDCVSRLGDID